MTTIQDQAIKQARAAHPRGPELEGAEAHLAALILATSAEEQADAAKAAQAPNPWGLSTAAREAATIEAHAAAARAKLRGEALAEAHGRVNLAREGEAAVLALAAAKMIETLQENADRAAVEAADRSTKEAQKILKAKRTEFAGHVATFERYNQEVDPLLDTMVDLVLEIERTRIAIEKKQQEGFSGAANAVLYLSRELGEPNPAPDMSGWQTRRTVHQRIAARLRANPLDGWDGVLTAGQWADREG